MAPTTRKKRRQRQQPAQTYNSSPHSVTSNVGVYVYTLQSKARRRRLNVLDDSDVNAGGLFQVDIIKEAAKEDQTWVEKTVHKPKAVVRKTSNSNDSVMDHRDLPWNLRSRNNLPWVLRSFSVICRNNARDEDKKRLSQDSCAAVKRPRKKVKKEDIKCRGKITTNESLKHQVAVFDEHSKNSTRTLRELNQNVPNFKNNLPHVPTVPEVKTIKQPPSKPTAISNGTMGKKQNRKKRIAPVNDSSKENDSKPLKIARRGTKRFNAQLKEHLERATKGGSDDLFATTPNRDRIVKLPMIPHIDSPIILDDMEAMAEFNGCSTPRSEFTCPTPVSIKATPVYRSYLSPLVTVRRPPARSFKSKLKHPTLKMTNKKAAQDRKWKKSLQKLIDKQLSLIKKSEEDEGHIIDDDEEDHSNDEYDGSSEYFDQ